MTLLHGRYELGELLGRGGLADVHVATDTRLSRQVAVKLLRDAAVDPVDRLRFENEARTLAALSHPSLVTVLDAGLDTGPDASPGATADRPFLVLELVHGPSLARAIDHGTLPLDRVRGIGRAVADALDHVHAAGVVHRDVKPGNVLLRTDGAVKLADFGIARIVGDLARHTRTGHAVGTAAYISPEQVRGTPVSGAADVYALGLTLLEALTGRREYAGHPAEAAFARLSRPPELPDDLPDDVRALLRAMTAIEPGERPSPAEVARALAEPAPAPVMSPAPAPAPAPAPSPAPSPDRTRVRMPAVPARAVDVPPPPRSPTPPPPPGPSLGTRLRAVPHERWVLVGVGLTLVLLFLVAGLTR